MATRLPAATVNWTTRTAAAALSKPGARDPQPAASPPHAATRQRAGRITADSGNSAGNFPGNYGPAENQDHEAEMGPNCPASVGTTRHRLTRELPADLHEQHRTTPLVTV
jgi:hypothetical protein